MIAYTITSLAYVPYARVLARTYAEHHGGNKLWVLLIDDVDGSVIDGDEPFHVLRLDDLNVDVAEIHRMAMLFGDKLIAVIKPWAFRHFLARGAEAVLYLDSDIMVFDTLVDLFSDPTEGVVLIPHVLSPVPRDGLDPDETTLLGAGMFNAGMFGVGRRGEDFLEFLMERLKRECIFDPRRMRFNEQRWLDFVPALFPHRIVRDPGYDVAYWNLHERPLEIKEGQWLVGGMPLRAFHFSSFEPRARRAGGRYELATSTPRVRVSVDPLFGDLCDQYRSRLYDEGFSDEENLSFGFDSLSDGVPVYDNLREMFRIAVLAADTGEGSYPPDPYEPSEVEAFRGWAREQYARVGLSLPLRMRELSVSTSMKRPKAVARWISAGRRRVGTDPLASSLVHPSTTPPWSLDLVSRMIVGEAGERRLAGIEIRPERAGFVCHGPRKPLSPGNYQLTIELHADINIGSASPSDQALVIEAFVQGYVVGSRAVDFADVSSGVIRLDIDIPERLGELAALLGLELRVLTRGQLRAWLTAILLEPGMSAEVMSGSWASHNDWLPVMAGGQAGIRIGNEVRTIAGATGVVVSGPNWRLTRGTYRVTIRTRISTGPLDAEKGGGAAPVVVILAVVVGQKVLVETLCTERDIKHGKACLEFEIAEADTGPEDQVGIRITTIAPIDAAVTSIVLDRMSALTEASESVA